MRQTLYFEGLVHSSEYGCFSLSGIKNKREGDLSQTPVGVRYRWVFDSPARRIMFEQTLATSCSNGCFLHVQSHMLCLVGGEGVGWGEGEWMRGQMAGW